MASKKRKVHPQFLPEVRRNEELDELFVFGYACKLFRDDVKTTEINKGQHLIPWMGNQKLLIDRYDGRGHLFDLDPYDADFGPKSVCSDEDRRIEALCDEERYLELHTDIAAKAAYEEEELKRLNEALSDNPYGAVAFNYDQPAPAEETGGNQAEEEDDEDEEEPYECPEELKKFITETFMMPETVKLNSIIEKTAFFVSQHGPQMEIVIKTKQKDNTNFHFLDMDHSLNAYYKKLVTLMKSGKYRPKPPEVKPRKRTRTCSSQESDDDDDEYGGSYLHPSLMAKPKAESSNQQEAVSPSRYQLSSDQVQDTAYAKLMNKITQLESGRNSPQNSVRSTDSPAPNNIGGEGDKVPLTQGGQPAPPGTETTVLPEELRNEMALNGCYLVPPTNIIPPPPDLQPIIDKMAEYVARNGTDFENTVKNKNDLRFEFLTEGHVFYTYYTFKKTIFERDMAQEKLLKEKEKEELEAEASAATSVATVAQCPDSNLQMALEDDKSQESLDLGAKMSVSFSIKVKEPERREPMEKRLAFADESSDEEGDESKDKSERSDDTCREKSLTPICGDLDGEDLDGVKLEERITSSLEDLDRKQAEHKIKDRLAMAARDKLAQSSKEKQMQAARKRKAAMFINMLKKSSGVKLEDNKEGAPSSTSGTASPVAVLLDSRSSSPFTTMLSIRRSKSKSPEKDRHRKHKDSKKSKKSPKKSRSKRHRSRSPHRRRSRTPPSSYAVVRRSRSRTRSPRPADQPKPRERLEKPKWLSRSRSRSRSKERSIRRKSKSPTKDKKSSGKSHSPSRRKRSRSRSKSRKTSSGSKSSRRNRSRSKDKSRKHRSRSRSKEKSKSKSKSKSEGKSSHRESSHSKSHKSRESKHKSDKKHRSKSPKSSQRSRSKSPKSEKRKLSASPPPTSSPKKPKLESIVAPSDNGVPAEFPPSNITSPERTRSRSRSSSGSSSSSSASSPSRPPSVTMSSSKLTSEKCPSPPRTILPTTSASPIRAPLVTTSVSPRLQLSPLGSLPLSGESTPSRSEPPLATMSANMLFSPERDSGINDQSLNEQELEKTPTMEPKKNTSDTKLSMEDIQKMRAMIRAKKEVLKEDAIFDI